MPDIAAANVAVTVLDRRHHLGAAVKRHRVRVVFGNGTLTYPAGGVPLPAFGAFGFTRELQFIQIADASDSDGLLYKYDAEGQKVRIWNPTQETGGAGNRVGVELVAATATPAATTLYAEAVGY